MFKKKSTAVLKTLPGIIAVSFLLLILPGRSNAQAPFFETGVISGPDDSVFALSAYPVIDRMKDGRLVCIFAVRTDAEHPKLKNAVSISDDNGKTWSVPQVIFDHEGKDDADPNLLVDGNRILAFSTTVKRPNKIDSTDIYMRTSTDGKNWTDEVHIIKPHRYICGKIHQGHRLKDGTLIMGYSWDTWAEQHTPAATEGEMNLKSGVLRSTDGGKTWKPGKDLYADFKKTSPNATWGLGEPATVVLSDGRILAIMRSGATKAYQSWSNDGGLTWSTPAPGQLTEHNSPVALWKLDHSKDIFVVWDNSPTGRTPLAAALSHDGGKTWTAPKILADTGGPQVSYPSAVQAADGTLIAVWQQDLGHGKREIRIARFNRAWLLGK